MQPASASRMAVKGDRLVGALGREAADETAHRSSAGRGDTLGGGFGAGRGAGHDRLSGGWRRQRDRERDRERERLGAHKPLRFSVGVATVGAPPVARIGGSAWVFLLSMIILMPTVTPWLRKRLG